MTLNEFRAWLEGFEASFTNGTPTAAQWKAVKAKLATIAGPVPATPPADIFRKAAIWPQNEPVRRYRTGTAIDQTMLLGYGVSAQALDAAAARAAEKADKVGTSDQYGH